MDFFQGKFRTFLSMAFVLLLTVPCSLKAEFKQFLEIDFTQKHNRADHKPACISYHETRQTVNRTFKSGSQPYLSAKAPSPNGETDHSLLAEFFSAQKEKIPSHLLFCQFLI